jgi:hypothetical protein
MQVFGLSRIEVPVMATNEYRLHAAECLSIADDITSPKHKLVLIAMAEAWLRLARRVEQGLVAVDQPPSPSISPVP